jgi:hypothetical protein
MINNIVLPATYNEDFMALLVQGPTTVYVYWELSEYHWDIINRYGRAVLRLYSFAGTESNTAQKSLTLEVYPPPFGASWYFNSVKPDAGYICQIGYLQENGEFLPVLSSNSVHTPALPVLYFKPEPKHNTKTTHKAFPAETIIDRNPFSLPLQDVLLKIPFYQGITV